MGQEQRRTEPTEEGRADHKPGQQQQQPQEPRTTGVGAESALKQMKEWERRRANDRVIKNSR
jgi:hypothetical protein